MESNYQMPPSSRRGSPLATGQSRGLRSRLFFSFSVPIAVLGLGTAILFEVILSRQAQGVPLSSLHVYLGIAGLLFLAVLLVAIYALHVGDHVIRPIAWLLRTIDAGQITLLSKVPPPPADQEIEALCGRVQVLLRQNLSGAKAMRKLDALQNEIGAVLDAVESNTLIPDKWPRDGSTEGLTRRLLRSILAQSVHQHESTSGIIRLQGLLEQDWREETLAVEEIVKRTERCFLIQTQILVELECLEGLVDSAPEVGEAKIPLWREASDLIGDLRLGIEKWHGEVSDHLSESKNSHPRRNWEGWIQESLGILSSLILSAAQGGESTLPQVARKLEKVAGLISGSGQEFRSLSREASQLLRAWNRLSERMRTLLARVEEMQEGARVAVASRREDAQSG